MLLNMVKLMKLKLASPGSDYDVINPPLSSY